MTFVAIGDEGVWTKDSSRHFANPVILWYACGHHGTPSLPPLARHPKCACHFRDCNQLQSLAYIPSLPFPYQSCTCCRIARVCRSILADRQPSRFGHRKRAADQSSSYSRRTRGGYGLTGSDGEPNRLNNRGRGGGTSIEKRKAKGLTVSCHPVITASLAAVAACLALGKYMTKKTGCVCPLCVSNNILTGSSVMCICNLHLGTWNLCMHYLGYRHGYLVCAIKSILDPNTHTTYYVLINPTKTSSSPL